MDSYQKLEESAGKASKALIETLDQCEAFQKKCDKCGEKVENLEKEKIALEKKVQELEARLERASKDVVDKFKQGGEL